MKVGTLVLTIQKFLKIIVHQQIRLPRKKWKNYLKHTNYLNGLKEK